MRNTPERPLKHPCNTLTTSVKIKGAHESSKIDLKFEFIHEKDLDGISARGAETIFSSPRERSACILQT